MTFGIWVLGDNLNLNQTALASCQESGAAVVLIESLQLVRTRPYHWQKLVLLWSAMRHFVQELQSSSSGCNVSYYPQSPDFQTALTDWIQKQGITELRVTEPRDRPFRQLIENLDLPCKVTILPDNSFIWTRDEFQAWVQPRKRILLEDFYREGRKKFNILMEGKNPVGGEWNFDKQNRKPPKGKLKTPPELWFAPDSITQEVIEITLQQSDSWSIVKPISFGWGVTRNQALQALDFFIQNRLAKFGTYQDAMVTGEETMWHCLLSPYLNTGLLHPWEVVKAVENAYLDDPSEFELNSIEGFIRQILGWREYMRGIYNYVAEDYSQNNWFNHDRPLPDFYWSGETSMNCLKQTIQQVRKTGYAHHIQRLMVLSNFGLIAGISPQALTEWFHAAFIDGYDWVMQTNVIGMGQFADGGVLASKPYAASANYINKMSDYCQNCTYNPKERTGEKACPFNYFYWDFLARHQEKLRSLGRMQLVLRSLESISSEELGAMQEAANRWHLERQSSER